MIRIQQTKTEEDRRPLREVLGMEESSGSIYGSTGYKRRATCPRAAGLYDLGVRKSGAKSENLDFGDAFHLVLEAYYRAQQRGMFWREAVALAWTVLRQKTARPMKSRRLPTSPKSSSAPSKLPVPKGASRNTAWRIGKTTGLTSTWKN
jgi:hypothetical protein